MIFIYYFLLWLLLSHVTYSSSDVWIAEVVYGATTIDGTTTSLSSSSTFGQQSQDISATGGTLTPSTSSATTDWSTRLSISDTTGAAGTTASMPSSATVDQQTQDISAVAGTATPLSSSAPSDWQTQLSTSSTTGAAGTTASISSSATFDWATPISTQNTESGTWTTLTSGSDTESKLSTASTSQNGPESGFGAISFSLTTFITSPTSFSTTLTTTGTDGQPIIALSLLTLASASSIATSGGGPTEPIAQPTGTASLLTTDPKSTANLISSTITTIPTGFSIEVATNSLWTANTWITTTVAGVPTIVPVLVGCPGCGGIHGGIIIWDLPPIPQIEFKLPGFPQLPTFHLPCIKIFGIKLSGDCNDPPSTDRDGPKNSPGDSGPPKSPDPTESPNPTESPDPSRSLDSTAQKETSVPSMTSFSSSLPSSQACQSTMAVACTQLCGPSTQGGGLVARSCADAVCETITACAVAPTTSTIYTTSTSTSERVCAFSDVAANERRSLPSTSRLSAPRPGLAKRVLSKPDSNHPAVVDEWFLDRVYHSPMLPSDGQNGVDYSSAEIDILGTGGQAGNNYYEKAVRGLHGCSVTIIATPEAVYMNHIWERSWGPQKFDNDVRTFLAIGSPRGWPGLDRYTIPGQMQRWELDPLKEPLVLVIAARDRNFPSVDSAAYPVGFRTVRDMLQRRFPNSPVKQYNYTTARYGEEDDVESTFGKVYIQYSPQEPDCEGVFRPTFEVWVQAQRVLRAVFLGYPSTAAIPVKRDISYPVCPLDGGDGSVTPYVITATYDYYTGPYNGPTTIENPSTQPTGSVMPTSNTATSEDSTTSTQQASSVTPTSETTSSSDSTTPEVSTTSETTSSDSNMPEVSTTSEAFTTSTTSTVSEVQITTTSVIVTQPVLCIPYQNPDDGGGSHCDCSSSAFSTRLPIIPSTRNPCGYTALPTPGPFPYTFTNPLGGIVACNTVTYFNIGGTAMTVCDGAHTTISAVPPEPTPAPTDPFPYTFTYPLAGIIACNTVTYLGIGGTALTICAGSRTTISAVPTRPPAPSQAPVTCTFCDAVLGWTFTIDGIDDGNGLSDLHHQESGCGALSFWSVDGTTVSFSLDFFIKAGCVERALETAGGPSISCQANGFCN